MARVESGVISSIILNELDLPSWTKSRCLESVNHRRVLMINDYGKRKVLNGKGDVSVVNE
jgi:hypothetical protein